MLQTFNKVYKPAYFTRLGLRYRNIINARVVSLGGYSVRDLIPADIAPELKTDIADDLTSLEKVTAFDDGEIKANVSHGLHRVTARFGQQPLNNEESYLIDIDCYYTDHINGIDNVLTKCDRFKQTERNIFEWSIEDNLRAAMEPKQLRR